MSNIVHKVKEAVTGHHDKPSDSTNAGPHDSNVANKLDPRVDSDRDHRATHSTTAGAHTATTGTGISSGTGYNTGTATTTTGPHDSNVANKLDPRVDSDRGQYGTTGGVTAGGALNDNPSSTNAGPHSSNITNKVDPRVDSDLDNRARHETLGGSGVPAGSSYTTPGSGNAQHTAGPHDSNIANKLDPRVDSDLDNSRTVGGSTTRY